MELTVLGCSGSYGAPPGGACSGYLLREGDTAIWMDCGNGTLPEPAAAHRSRPSSPRSSSPTSIPDHCVDIYGLHVLLRYGARAVGLPVFAPGRRRASGSGTWSRTGATRSTGTRSTTATRRRVGAIDLALLPHRPPAADVRGRGDRADGRRLVYTADTGPGVERRRVRRRARTSCSPRRRYLHDNIPLADPPLGPPGRRGRARGPGASGSCSPTSGPRSTRRSSVAEGSEAFGDAGHARRRRPHLPV